MISSLSGSIRALSLDSAVVVVGGVGLRVQATPSTLASLSVGQTADLATSLVVREDALTLFGFADEEERDAFELLQTVSGVGPRLALAMLAVHTPEQLRAAVAAEDFTALMRVPGIGRKGAQRIVLEIGDRLGPPQGGSGGGVPPRALATSTATAEVVDALVQLGWPARAAEQAVATAVDGVEDAALDTSAVLRTALRTLGGHGGSQRG